MLTTMLSDGPARPFIHATTPAALTIDALVAALAELAADQSIRVVEAIAATLANRARRAYGAAGELPALPAASAPPASAAAAGMRACFRRIAMRALHGTLTDPTGGATAFHPIDQTPDWARPLMPIAVHGSYLFYRC
jgi:hypothetical protein